MKESYYTNKFEWVLSSMGPQSLCTACCNFISCINMTWSLFLQEGEFIEFLSPVYNILYFLLWGLIGGRALKPGACVEHLVTILPHNKASS